ncbi:MAG: radical SAM family heme chaperone HemW [Rhizobiaceae bacterium]|nr:radical SAM family heme chaperone HemW [Rhizobiaceae bacterium]
MSLPPDNAFGVYVHWPFCAAKCPYCDFNSHVRHNPVDQQSFVEAYEREIAHIASLSGSRTVTSVFFGGGTPSLMAPNTVETILNTIGKHWSLATDAEISMEANPSSVEAERFKGYRTAGVNRVSLGIQSLQDDQLKFLGRLHNASEAIGAIEIAQAVFPRMSFDLIYARPNQTASEWEAELKQAIDLSAGHLSLYQLTIEEGTRFFDLHEAGKLNPLDENPSAELYELTQSITADAGYQTYEISNHAKPGHECEHNLVYWRGQDYAGIGPGAHGRLTSGTKRLATSTHKNPEEWWQQAMVNGHGMEDQFTLLPEEQADEFLLMGLRLAEGIHPKRFEALRGEPINPQQIEFLETLGLIQTKKSGAISATPKGFLLLDAVVADLAA